MDIEKIEKCMDYQKSVGMRYADGISDCELLHIIEKFKEYQNIIHAIANIDTIFMNQDGTDREWDDKEALETIEKMVMPIWDEHCEMARKETKKMFEEWGINVNLD